MGNFYTNYTLRGPSQQSVAAELAGRSAIVTPSQAGCVVVFDEESEDQDQEIIAELGSRLSGRLSCPLLAVLNHDDDILWYQLYLNGELIDEYDSAPDYFGQAEEGEGGVEGSSVPKGGDAEKLCRAFAVKGASKVEKILRNQKDYAFAVERHAALVDALGLPSFSAGTGFGQVSGDELPEELSNDELVSTEAVTVPGTDHQPADAPQPKTVPGYYKVSFRDESDLEKSIPIGWMPNLWADLECEEQCLSDQFRQMTAKYRLKFATLGFAEQGFKKVGRILNRNFRDTGGINYLDASRRYFGQLIYNRSYLPSLQSEKESVIISITAVFATEAFSYTNQPDFLGPVPNHEVTRIPSDDVAVLFEQFEQRIRQRLDVPRHFPDLRSLQTWFDSTAWNVLEHRVRQGTWVRMSEFEVESARRKMNGLEI